MFGLAKFYHGRDYSASVRIFAAPTLRKDEGKFSTSAQLMVGFTFA
jgi:hypothetical protein